MTSEWPLLPLADLVDDRGITYGVVQPGNAVDDGIPIVRVNNFSSAGLKLDDVLRIDGAIEAKHSRSRLRGGEVLLTLVGSTGQVAVADSSVAGWNVARAVGVIPVRSDIPSRWVAWCLQSPYPRAFLDARANTTVQKTINLRDVAAVPVPMPSLDEIDAISSVLGALDDKIESNRRLAALLEETASTLFKARFVDFVGVDEFEDSEIGPIPVGWYLGSVYDVARVTYGRPFRSSVFSDREGIPLLRIRDIATGEPALMTTEQRSDGRLITAGDIVVGMDGEFRAHVWAGPDSWLNQRVCAFDPIKAASRVFVLESIKRPLAFFEATKGGTTVIHLGKADIDTFKFVLPTDAIMHEFAEAADPLLRQSVALRLEARTLADVRDGLLPKLVSGAIRVPDTTDVDEVIGPLVEAVS